MNKKILVRFLNCIQFDLREIEKFCIKFKEKYGEDIFEKLIGDLYNVRNSFFRYDKSMKSTIVSYSVSLLKGPSSQRELSIIMMSFAINK